MRFLTAPTKSRMTRVGKDCILVGVLLVGEVSNLVSLERPFKGCWLSVGRDWKVDGSEDGTWHVDRQRGNGRNGLGNPEETPQQKPQGAVWEVIPASLLCFFNIFMVKQQKKRGFSIQRFAVRCMLFNYFNIYLYNV